MADKIKRLVGFWDTHFPYQLPCYFDLNNPNKQTPIFKFLKDFDPHIVIDGGDNLDLDCITYHNRGKPKLTENKRLSKDYEGYNRMLDARDKYLKSVEQHVMFSGNHEYWVEMIVEEMPQLTEGLVEVPTGLHLKSRGYKWIPSRLTWNVGKLFFIHGDYKNGYMPEYHAKAIGMTYQRNMVYGHFHSEQQWTKISPIDTHPIQTQSVGTMGRVNPMWMRNSPNAWINSFYIAYLLPNGDYFGQTVKIFNGKFIFDGVSYQ